MKPIKLTARKKEIIHQLMNSNQYMTISSIANQIDVSPRTVLRDLDQIGSWLASHGIHLEKKTGVGILLQCSPTQREQLGELINSEGTVKDFTPQERQVLIASELLQTSEPIKLYYLTKILRVSEGTISHDLDRLEGWMSSYQLVLIRKPGYGIFVEGHEKNKRRAIINLIYENMNEKQLLNLIQKNITQSPQGWGGIEIKVKKRLLDLMDQETITKLGELVYAAESKMDYKLADSAYVGLIVHLSLAIKRIRNNEKIRMDRDFLVELRVNPEFMIAKNLAAEIAGFFNIEINEDEVGYITMHLMGSKNRGNAYQGGQKTSTNKQLIKIANEMIRIAENETGRVLEGNERLLQGLVNHLEPTIKRLKMKMDIRNPLLQEIKTLYPHLLRISEKCARVLEEYLGQKLPESEIAYIAMHLGAVIEKQEVIPLRKLRVAVACPSGIGTSRLLATRVEKEYEQIQVIDVISAIHMAQSWIHQEEVDFVISTVPIENLSVPVMVVNPLLLEEDQEIIDQLIIKLKQSAESYENPRIKSFDLKEKLQHMNEYNQAMLQILNHFFIETVEAPHMEALIHHVAGKLVSDEKGQTQLTDDLLRREQLGGTYITSKGFTLLHCRTNAVKELFFGGIRWTCGEKEPSQLVVVMVVPETLKSYEREVIGEMSIMIIDQPSFLTHIESGSKEQAYKLVSHTLNTFYEGKMRLNSG